MKKLYMILLVISVLAFNTHFAQVISLAWARGAGSSSDDFSEDIAADKWGNSYTTGYFYSPLNFGTSTLTPTGTDVFVAKLNSSGNLIWARQIGGSGTDQTGSICIDNQQFIYIAGWFSGTADFDPGPGSYSMTSIGTTDAFVCKLDSAGNFVWAKQFGGSGQIYANDIVTDSLGAVYVTGYFTQSGDFNPGAGTHTLTSAGTNDMFVCKLTSAGNFVWAKSVGETGNDGGSVICNYGDNIFISGWFNNTCDLDPGAGTFFVTSNGGYYDIFILKLDTAGNFSWGGSIGGALTDFCKDITADAGGNIYMTGFFEGTSDFNPGPATYSITSAGSEDIFVLKLGSSGALKWAKVMGGPAQDDGRGIRTANGYVFTTGFFSASADFDPGNDYAYTLTSSGNADIFLSQLDSYGNFVCAANMGGPGSDTGNAMDVDSTGMIYITGMYSGNTNLPADFDPGPGSFTMTSTNSTYDIFTAKYSGCSNLANIKSQEKTDDHITVFPNPTSNLLTVNAPAGFINAEIIDSKGQTVKELTRNTDTRIDMSDLSAGIYLLKIKTAEGSFIKKIVKD